MKKLLVVSLFIFSIVFASCKENEHPTIAPITTKSAEKSTEAANFSEDSSTQMSTETSENASMETTTAPQKSLIPQYDSSDFVCDSSAFCVLSEEGDILVERDCFSSYAPASITKILTLLVTVENVPLTDKVTVTEQNITEDVDIMSSGVYPSMKPYETFTVEELLQMLIMPSTNAAGNVLATHVAGSVEKFVDMMNEKVEALGLSHSHFVNPHGLDRDGHYTCAYDMAIILKACIENKDCQRILSTPTYTIPATIYNVSREMSSANSFVNGSLECGKVLGSKSGCTINAGNTLVTAVKLDGNTYYACTMHSNEGKNYTDTDRLIKYTANKCTGSNYEIAHYAYDLEVTQDQNGITMTQKTTGDTQNFHVVYWLESEGTASAVSTGEQDCSGRNLSYTLPLTEKGVYIVQFIPEETDDVEDICVFVLLFDGENHRNEIVSFDGKSYYINEHGTVDSGAIETEDGCFYASDHYAISYGFVGGRFYAGADGRIVTGWFTQDYEKYYAGADGRIVTGKCYINGKLYTFDQYGMLVD